MRRRGADRRNAWALGAAMKHADPVLRMNCIDCANDEDCNGGCLPAFQWPTGLLVAFLALMSWFAVVGVLTVFSWFL